jgi:hypothetical protein
MQSEQVNMIDGHARRQKIRATLSGVNAPAALREAAERAFFKSFVFCTAKLPR